MTLIHCVEDKPNHSYIENLLTYIDSTPENYFNNFKIYLIQPSNNDIPQTVIDTLPTQFKYIKYPFKTTVKNLDDFNPLVMPLSINLITDKIDDIVVYHDIDVIIKDDIYSELKTLDISKIHVSIFPNFDDTTNRLENFDLAYLLVKVHLNLNISEVNYYINTYMIVGHSKNKFWKEWKELSEKIIDISKLYDGDDRDILENINEELAVTLLYIMNKENFCDLPKSLKLTEDFDTPLIFHYETYENLIDILTPNINKYKHLFKRVFIRLRNKGKIDMTLIKRIFK
jgi:hypothetical protein